MQLPTNCLSVFDHFVGLAFKGLNTLPESISGVFHILLAITLFHFIHLFLNQWQIQRLSDVGIPVWAPKLGAQIKGERMQNNNSHLISSTQMRLHVLRYLTK